MTDRVGARFARARVRALPPLPWLAVAAVTAVVATVAAAPPLRAAEVELKARVEPPGPYAIGDRLRFVWEVSCDPQVQVGTDLVSELGKALADAQFEAAASPAAAAEPAGAAAPGAAAAGGLPRIHLATRATADRKVTVLSAPVTVFTTGVHRVAAIKIAYRDAAGKAMSAATPEMAVTIQSVMAALAPGSGGGAGAAAAGGAGGAGSPGPGKLEPRPLKPPVAYTYRFELPLWVYVALVATIAAVALLVRRLRRPRTTAPPPPVPADQEAFMRIDELLAEGILACGQVKEFCDRLSDILRRYLSRRFGLPAMGETSVELLAALEAGGSMSEPDRSRLREFLVECDLAKFARHRPEPAHLTALVESARSLVTSTRPPGAPGARAGADPGAPPPAPGGEPAR
jgi:hypothetical protein